MAGICGSREWGPFVRALKCEAMMMTQPPRKATHHVHGLVSIQYASIKAYAIYTRVLLAEILP